MTPEQVKEKRAEIVALHESTLKNFDDFFGKGNKTAGTRLRKDSQSTKTLFHDLRKTVTEVKND